MRFSNFPFYFLFLLPRNKSQLPMNIINIINNVYAFNVNNV